MKKRDSVVRAATAGGQRAGEVIVEAVEKQLRDNNPPETRQTLERLMKDGETRENAMRYIASSMAIEIFDILKNNAPYNEARYVANLKALPRLPDD
jgi:hypothetical protein